MKILISLGVFLVFILVILVWKYIPELIREIKKNNQQMVYFNKNMKIISNLVIDKDIIHNLEKKINKIVEHYEKE